MTRVDTMSKRTDGTTTGRRVFACRVAVETPAIVEALAKELGCLRVDGAGDLVGACGVMLDRIASGQLKVIASNALDPIPEAHG
jgi:hypothetical protein